MHNEQFTFEQLSDFHLDALQEVGNIGAGHAAVALTQFLNRSTYMSIPNVALDHVESIHRLVKMPSDQDLAIISLNTVSDLKYSLLVFFEKESVDKIIDLMTTSPDINTGGFNGLSPLFFSLIKESPMMWFTLVIWCFSHLHGSINYVLIRLQRLLRYMGWI